MSLLDTDPEVQELLRDAAPRAAARLSTRERWTEAAFGAALLATVGVLHMAASRSELETGPVALLGLVVLCALAERVRFSLGAGTASPAQLVFIPLFVLVPPALVPLLVIAGLNLTRLPEYLRRRTHPDHVLLTVGDAWCTAGAAIVLVLLPPGTFDVGDLPVWGLALVAQLAFDAGMSAARGWAASGIRPGLHVRLYGLAFVVDVALTPLALVAGVAARDTPIALLAVAPLLALLALLAQERERRIEHALALSDAYRGSALLMGEMLEADDAYTGGEHSKGVVALALAVGRELDLDARDSRQLEFGALLHDVGKLRTPDEIINKPGKLTPEEWEVIRRHPVDGQEMLDRIGGALAEVGLTVRHHHERWDGGGYPDGLVGDAIPLAARIICACDAFNAMTTDRSYRRAMPLDAALVELRSCAGTQFDPRVVDAVAAVVERARPPRLSATLAAAA